MKKEKLSFLIIVLLAIAVTVYTLSYIVLSPGEVLLSTNGDGAKNYFTFLYHALYGNGLQFEGMNYPYGEHIVFTDGQPVFAVILGYLNQYLHINPLVVMHLLIGFGFFLGIVYVYKILLCFKVHRVWAMLFACLIIIMSPQQLKLTGHFSLVYACVLPMLFYYNLSWLQTEKRKYVWRLFLAASLFAFVHVYFTLMYCLWTAFYSLGYLVLYKRQFIQKLKHLYPLWLAVVLPIVSLKVFMLLTDHVSDRPDYPYGARANRTFTNDIFTSYISPIWAWVAKHAEGISLRQGNEGYTYIGIASITILIITFFINRLINTTDKNQSLAVWLCVAAGMLIFASSIIFRKCFVCLDYASFIRQFRAVGRFAWAFYYIATISSVVILYRWHTWLHMQGKKTVAYILAMSFFLIWFFEAIPFASKTRALAKSGLENYNTQYDANSISWHSFLKQHGYTKDSFQSILVLPYVHIGTEKLGVNAGHSNILTGAFHASLQLHLPIMDVMMSRTSWSQAFAQVKIAGGAFTDKHILYMDCDSSKPVLILFPENTVPNRNEWHLLDAASDLGNQQGYNVYALYPDVLHKIEQKTKDSLHQIFDVQVAKDTCLNNCGLWAVEHYDNGQATEKLFGSGAEKAIEGNTDIVFNHAITPMYNNQVYEFSAWTLVSNKDYRIGRFRIMGFDEKDSLILNEMVLVQESVDNKGLWLRASKYFKLPLSCTRVEVELINVINPAYLALDELMVRPAEAIILSKMPDGSGMVNNHVFR